MCLFHYETITLPPGKWFSNFIEDYNSEGLLKYIAAPHLESVSLDGVQE
jgi:hypothetical protein